MRFRGLGRHRTIHRAFYPIGAPFWRLARKAKALRPALRIKQPLKIRLHRILLYPIGAPFWRLARKAKALSPIRQIRQPSKNRLKRILAYPIGVPFFRIPIKRQQWRHWRLLQPKRNRLRRIAYPIGVPFFRVARGTRRIIKRWRSPAFRLRGFLHTGFVVVALPTIRGKFRSPKLQALRRVVPPHVRRVLGAIIVAPVTAVSDIIARWRMRGGGPGTSDKHGQI